MSTLDRRKVLLSISLLPFCAAPAEAQRAPGGRALIGRTIEAGYTVVRSVRDPSGAGNSVALQVQWRFQIAEEEIAERLRAFVQGPMRSVEIGSHGLTYAANGPGVWIATDGSRAGWRVGPRALLRNGPFINGAWTALSLTPGADGCSVDAWPGRPPGSGAGAAGVGRGPAPAEDAEVDRRGNVVVGRRVTDRFCRVS